jgi:hypothetical protein
MQLNEPFLIQSTETKETVALNDNEEVATLLGRSKNGNFGAIGSVRAVPFGASRPYPMIVIECDAEIWGNKELTEFLLASKGKAKEHGFVGFTFRDSARLR